VALDFPVSSLILPFGNYRFRADKSGTQYWSGPSNHCTVPGCTTAAITVTTGGANNGGRALAQTRLPVNDPSLLLLAPLAMLALARRKGKRQRWATLAAAMLLVVAVMGTGMTLAGDDGAPVVLAAPSDLRGLGDLEGLPRAQDFAPRMSAVVARSAASQALTTTTTVIHYAYDPLQRLTSATYSDGKSFQYEYDAVGNRTVSTQTITSTLVTSYTYDAANRLTSVNGVPYTWDNNGNLTSDGSKSYLYNQANRLITVTATSLTWSATYNGDGARLKQNVNGAETMYTLDLAAPLVTVLAERTSATTKQYVYGQGDSPLASYDDTLSGVEGWTYLSGRDGINSVRQETDVAGNIVTLRSFDPYGVPMQGNGGQPFGYTGEMWDSYINLAFLRARYYDGRTGRFTQQDPSGLERNLYVYASANSVNRTDPLGLFSLRALAKSFGYSNPDDKEGFLQYFASLGSWARWGWMAVLLSANDNDMVKVGAPIVFPPYLDETPEQPIRCVEDGKIRIGLYDLQRYTNNTLEQSLNPAFFWRNTKPTTYLLNGKWDMDYDRPRDLPDFRALSIDIGFLFNYVFPGLGQIVSLGALPAIDRHGYLYLTGFGGVNPNISLPPAVFEGYVAREPGAILHPHLPSPQEVYETITGGCGNLNLLMLTPEIGVTVCQNSSSALVHGYGVGASLGLTFSWGFGLGDPQLQIPSLAWDYIDQEQGYTRANVENMLSNEIDQCDNCGQ
jgi:RHS repeat-associated protein